jgi:glutamate synthase domain-containing protein 1
MTIAGWRDVPTDKSVLGALAADFVPDIKQVVFKAEWGPLTQEQFELILYDMRREMMVSCVCACMCVCVCVCV